MLYWIAGLIPFVIAIHRSAGHSINIPLLHVSHAFIAVIKPQFGLRMTGRADNKDIHFITLT